MSTFARKSPSTTGLALEPMPVEPTLVENVDIVDRVETRADRSQLTNPIRPFANQRADGITIAEARARQQCVSEV